MTSDARFELLDIDLPSSTYHIIIYLIKNRYFIMFHILLKVNFTGLFAGHAGNVRFGDYALCTLWTFGNPMQKTVFL